MGRKNLIQVIILTGTIILAVLVADKLVYFSLNRISDRVQSGYLIGKLNRYLAVKDTTDILIYGSSRTNHHVDAGMMPASAYNIGLDGVRLGYITPLIKMLPPDREQMVLVHVDSYDQFFEGKDTKLLQTKYHREPIIREEIRRTKQKHPLQDIFWTLDYNGTILGILRNLVMPPFDPDNYTGFDPEVITGERRKTINAMLLDDSEHRDQDPMAELNQMAGSYLLEIKEFCEKNNKTLIIFTSPMFRYTKSINDEALTRFLEENGFTYLDFTHLFGPDVPLEWWRDKTHLTEESAQIFTQHLIEEIQELEHEGHSSVN